MTNSVIRLIPSDEMLTLGSYLEGAAEPEQLEQFFDSIGVPNDAQTSRLSIAVAQIILNEIQGELPQWFSKRPNKNFFGRRHHKRHEAARLAFTPQKILCLNWADSGPGFSWPEEYHVTYIPGFDKHIVTASRDSADVWGCTDHAIGFEDGSLSPEEAAHIAVVKYWRMQEDWGQPRWAYLFSSGLVNAETAEEWADEVWEPEEQDMLEDEVELSE